MTIAQELMEQLQQLIDQSPVPAADALDALAEVVRNHCVEDFLKFMKKDDEQNRAMLIGIQNFYE